MNADDKNVKSPTSLDSNPGSLLESPELIEPPTYGGPFHPLDLEYCGKFPCWSDLQLSCFSLGYNFDLLSCASPEELQEYPKLFETLRRRLILVRSARDAKLLDDPMPPLQGIEWLASRNEPIFPGLVAACEKYSKELVPISLSQTEKYLPQVSARLDALEENIKSDNLRDDAPGLSQKYSSLQKICLGMATDKYQYDTRAQRSPAARLIQGAADLVGLSVDQGTIRSQLREASEKHLPEADD